MKVSHLASYILDQELHAFVYNTKMPSETKHTIIDVQCIGSIEEYQDGFINKRLMVS